MDFFKPTSSSDQFLKRKLKYLRVVFTICLTLMGIYFLRYNFEFGTTSFNGLFILTFALILPSPYIYSRTKNLTLASSLIVWPATIYLLILIWTSGGIDAPGVFWLSAIPLTTAILLGVRVSIFSIFIIALFLLTSIIAKTLGYDSNILGDVVDPKLERTINVITFMIYSLVTSIYFIQAEAKFQVQISEQKNEIDNLLKILVHDIANPLTNMIFILNRLRNGKATNLNEAHQNLGRFVGNIKLLLEQVRSLRALKDGKAFIEKSPVLLSQILTDLQRDLRPQLEQKQINLIIKQDHFVPYLVGDPNVLKQVILTNILTNAIKFSPAESSIEITTSQEQDFIMIEVRDYGIGIPPAIQKNLFSTHEHTHRKGTAGESGTGFGMPLVKEFTQKLGGQLDFHSSETDSPFFPRGTRVRIKFPALPESKDSQSSHLAFRKNSL